MNSLRIAGIGESYWLASRSVESNSNYVYFHIRYAYDSGSLYSSNLCDVHSNSSTYSYSNTYGLRPIFHLKSNIKITGGSGTEEDPYELGK